MDKFYSSIGKKEIVHLIAGLAIGSLTTITGYYVIKNLKKRRRRKGHHIGPNFPSVPAIQRSISNTSTDGNPRRFHRLLSTSADGNVDEGVALVDDDYNEQQTMMNLLYCIAENQARREGYLHRGITCNICSQSPIQGIRYKCANCSDYDVCDKCEPKDDHNVTHVFLKIMIPLPPLSSPRTCLVKTMYPGKYLTMNHLSIEEIIKYAKETKFTQYEIEGIYSEYRSLSKSDRGISREVFDFCLGPLALESNLVLERLFKFYDKNGDRFIDFDEMIRGLSVLCRGSLIEKIPFAFEGYDLENKKSLSRDNMRRMFKAYYEITMELVRDVVKACEDEMMANFDDSSGRPVSALFSAPIPFDSGSNFNSRSIIKPPIPGNPGGAREGMWPVMEAMSQDAIKEMVDKFFTVAEIEEGKRLNYQKFVEVATIDNNLVLWFDSLGSVF